MSKHRNWLTPLDRREEDPDRVLASTDGILAAWLIVLAVGAAALIPGIATAARSSALEAAHIARARVVAALHEIPSLSHLERHGAAIAAPDFARTRMSACTPAPETTSS